MRRIDRMCAFNTIITGGFAALFLYLRVSGRALNFVHPRMLLFVSSAGLVLAILTLAQARRLFTVHGHGAGAASLLLLVPLALAATLTPGALDSSMAGRKGVSLGETKRSVSAAKPSSIPRQGKDASGPAGKTAPAAGPGVGKARIVFRDETFLAQLGAIYKNLGAMAGREVELIGFVYRQEDFAADDFVIARYAITCCAADAQVVGLLCRNTTGRPVRKDAWVKVRGIIEEASYVGQAYPRVRVNEWEEVTAPKNAYVY